MNNLAVNFLKNKQPLLYVEKICGDIKVKVKDIELPDLDSYETEFKNYIKITQKLKFKDNNYSLARKFEILRIIFFKLYSKAGNRIKDLSTVVDYLRAYELYFEMVHNWLKRKYNKTDANVDLATKLLRFEIEIFCYKYEFLIKDDEANILESLTTSNFIGEEFDSLEEHTGNEKRV